MEFNEITVLQALQPVIELKKSFRKKTIKRDEWTPAEYQPYHESYILAAKWFDELKPHTQKGYFPESLFAKRAPNETPKETTYIRENYQQVTLTIFKDFIETNGRALHRNNWSITYDRADQDKGELSLQEYLNNLPLYGSLEAFTFQYLPPLKYADAEGVVVIMPKVIPTEQTSTGEVIISESEFINPVPEFFHCTRVVLKTDELVVIESDELVDVFYGDYPKREGLVFYAFDKNTIFRIYQIGKKVDWKFNVEVFWNHNIGIIPVRTVGGVSTKIDDINIQLSPYSFVVPPLNDVIIDSTMLRGIKATCGYPYRIMIGDKCQFMIKHNGESISCDGGYHFYDGTLHTCTSCNGTGMTDRVSPYGTLLINPKSILEDGDKGIDPTKAMFYAAPSVDMPKFIREEIQRNEQAAYNTLHIKRVEEQATGGAPKTATETIGEQKALMASIEQNTKQLFELFRWEIKVIAYMRNGVDTPLPIVHEPTRFDIFIESDDIKLIKDAMDAGMPTFVIQTMIYNYLKKAYYTDQNALRLFTLISSADRLFAMGKDEITQKKSQRLIDDWEVILHDSAIAFVNELIMADETFLNNELNDQIAALIDLAKQKTALIPKQASTVLSAAATNLNGILQS